ncbi:MAG: hypothetical protein ACI9YT_000239 [Halobacteriales archaeon]
MTLYDDLASLPLAVEDYDLSTRRRPTSSDFTRVTTVFALHGPGETGRGEDVTYDEAEHDALAEEGATIDFPTPGEYTLDEFSARLDTVDLFPAGDPEGEAARHYRRWGLESAALDLALRQADANLGTALDRSYDPVRFVVSTRLGDPPAADRVERFLDADPTHEFKLDPTPDWTPELVETLADTGAVRILDLKGQYEGTEVDGVADPELYGLLLDAFPEAVIEDPAFTDETRPLFDGEEERVSWDVPITDVASVEALPFEPDWLNVKPSRFGTVRDLLDTIEYCLENDVRPYGGGQFELDVGREHLHAVASLFYPDAPNDVAPSGYNDPDPGPELPSSPLQPPADPEGLGWN